MYTAREVAAVLGVTVGRLRSYLRSGTVRPSRGEDGGLRFSFQDLVLLRKAEGLITARIPPRRVHHALRKLRQRLPETTPLSGIRLSAEGCEIVVDDGSVRWRADSGQVVFPFDREPEAGAGELRQFRRADPPPPQTQAPLSAQELYERGCAVEERDPAEAQRLYRLALTRDPDLPDAHVNLGRLVHEAGDVHTALLHYRAALKVRPEDATASFNVGVALEDLGSLAEATEAYERAITRDPANADAHYNLARLLDRMGRPEIAIRHLLIYRQLTRGK